MLWAQRTITLDDFLNGERVSGVALSPKGSYVLEHFTVTDGPQTQRHSIVKRLADGAQVARYDSVRVEWMPRTEALLLHRGDSLVRIDPVTDARTVLARNLPKRSRITMAPTEDYLILSCWPRAVIRATWTTFPPMDGSSLFPAPVRAWKSAPPPWRPSSSWTR